MREFAKIVVITIFILIVGTFIAAFISYQSKEKQVITDGKKLQELYPNILEGVSSGPTEITIDYSKPIANGSPLIFGGSHSPSLEHTSVWNEIEKIGVTSVRKDFFPENALPKNITLEDYKNNKDNVQDTQTWNQTELNKINNTYKFAKERGMKTIGIAAYSPAWLTHSNTYYGVPKDWDVYKDIIKKTYTVYRDNLDYVEIWNEPSFEVFLDLKNSNLSREQAYKMIFKNATDAIREVDAEINDGKKMKIGGPVSHRPIDTAVLEEILKDSELKKELDFISYHNYEAEHLKEPSDIYFKPLMQKYNVQNLPIFITEWNYHPSWENLNSYNTGNIAIPFTGRKFISYLKMGIEGANYHTLESINESRPNRGEGRYGFYRWNNGDIEMLPQSKTWNLLSKQMRLGQGTSQIFETNIELAEFTIAGFKNIDQNYGIILSNESSQSESMYFTLNNLPIKNFTEISIYNASGENDATTPIYKGLLKVENGNAKIRILVPKESIIGISLDEENSWYDKLNFPFIN